MHYIDSFLLSFLSHVRLRGVARRAICYLYGVSVVVAFVCSDTVRRSTGQYALTVSDKAMDVSRKENLEIIEANEVTIIGLHIGTLTSFFCIVFVFGVVSLPVCEGRQTLVFLLYGDL